MLLGILVLIVVFVAGGIGGLVNALLSDNRFWWPKTVSSKGRKIVSRPGFIGNILISGVAACISWGLYGPFAASYIIGGPVATAPEFGLTLSAAAGALLVGVSGARWLTNEVDKTLLRTAATASQQDKQKAAQIALATPTEALHLAQEP